MIGTMGHAKSIVSNRIEELNGHRINRSMCSFIMISNGLDFVTRHLIGQPKKNCDSISCNILSEIV